MTIDCSATAFVIRLGWILHLNHFIIYVPNSCQCHLEAVWLVIHHTLSFSVVINIVMWWTFTVELPGGWECRSLQGGSCFSKRESTEGGLSGVVASRLTLRRCCYFPLSAINLPVPSSFSPRRSQVERNLPSSHAASHRKILDALLSLSFSIRASITTCQSHASAASGQTHTSTRWHIGI